MCTFLHLLLPTVYTGSWSSSFIARPTGSPPSNSSRISFVGGSLKNTCIECINDVAGPKSPTSNGREPVTEHVAGSKTPTNNGSEPATEHMVGHKTPTSNSRKPATEHVVGDKTQQAMVENQPLNMW